MNQALKPTHTPTPWIRYAIFTAAFLLLLFMFKGLSAFTKNAWLSITFPNTMDYGEGPIVNQAVRLSRFQNIYPNDLNQAPYTVTNYPPVFLAVQVPFVWIFGAQFWYGRLISTLAVLLGAVSIAVIIHTLTKNWLAAVFSALMLLCMPFIIDWAPTNRVDSLALGLSLAGLMVVVRGENDRKKRILAAVLFVLAAYTKQMYAFCAPFAAFVWLLREKPRQKAFELFYWVAGLGLGGFALLTLITRGGFFTQLITANNNAFYWETTRHYINEVKQYFLLFLLFGGLFLISVLFKATRHRAWWLIAPYFAATLVISLAIGKDGSYINYLFEISAAFALLLGMWLALPMQIFPKWPWLPIVLILFLILPVHRVNQLTQEKYTGRVQGRINEADQIEHLYKKVSEMEGTILLDEFMGFLPLLDRELYFQPFERKMLADDGSWDESDFVRQIEEKQFSAIIIYYPEWALAERGRWTQAQATAIRENYIEGVTIAHAAIFIPRQDWMNFEIEFED